MTGDAPARSAQERKAKKKTTKFGSAWISVGGRIGAQIVYAVGSVVLGIIVVTSYGLAERTPSTQDSPSAIEAAHIVRPCAERRLAQVDRSDDRVARDVLSLQCGVAIAMAKAVNVTMTPRLEQRFANRGTIDPAVYDTDPHGVRADPRFRIVRPASASTDRREKDSTT